jgi:hypothetical protein
MTKDGRMARLVAVLCFVWMAVPAVGEDWPTWRHDAGRTAVSAQRLADRLHLQWVREYPTPEPAFSGIRQQRVQFDLGYEPVVAGQLMFVALGARDCVTALDSRTGAERWRFYAEGPVRLAPAAWDGRVYFSSDDGRLYCLDAATGRLAWSQRLVPSERKVLGNGRLISAWPARGGPVVHEGRVYATGGIWPFEGIFVWALDARTGRRVWLNDQTGSMYCEHPHGAMSFGGPSPQGYLLIHHDQLVVPSGRAFPAFFELAGGKLASFEFGHGGHGSRPGSWFVARDVDGRLCVDPQINTEVHDAGDQVIGQTGVRHKPGEPTLSAIEIGRHTYQIQDGVASQITAGGRTYRFADGWPGVEGPIHTMLAADDRLFVVARSGRIYCFGPELAEVREHRLKTRPLPTVEDRWTAQVQQVLADVRTHDGLAVAWGLGSGRLVEELLRQSTLHVIVVEPDAKKVATWRQRFDEAGLYGTRVAIHQGSPEMFPLPPYAARLIVAEAEAWQNAEPIQRRLAASLRPYGGLALLPVPGEHLGHWRNTAGLWRVPDMEVRQQGTWLQFRRPGPLAGAADYHGTKNADDLVRAPLGLLWFGDTYHHHKLFYQGFQPETGRGLPQTITVARGVMSYAVPRPPHAAQPAKVKYLDYLRELDQKPYDEVYVDVYTGMRVERETERGEEKGTVPFSLGRKLGQSPDNAGAPWPLAAERRNPITGVIESREVYRTYGCDQWGADYGNVVTMRSGTAAFYDARLESGTINVSGMRSGCRNSIVPADGILCLPSWTGNCTCNYPIYTSLGLGPVAEDYEQWAAWGQLAVDAPVRRVGINFGAPGDRMTRSGTLWLDWPSVGGPSPDVPVEVTPATAEAYYRHALWMAGGESWPWIVSSGLKGVESIRVSLVARRPRTPGGTFSVRWTGWLRPRTSETYTFFLRTDERARLWLGEKLLLDNSKALRRGDGRELAAKFDLVADTQLPIRVEYFRRTDVKQGGARLELAWASPSVPKELIPSERLISPAGRPGLTGAYYEGSTVTGPAVLQTDPWIRFDWGSQYPQPLRRAFECAPPAMRPFTVRLHFAEPEELRPGERVFSVLLAGREVLPTFDIAREAGASCRGVVREFKGIPCRDVLELAFRSSTPRPAVISGVEMIEE